MGRKVEARELKVAPDRAVPVIKYDDDHPAVTPIPPDQIGMLIRWFEEGQGQR